MADDPAVGEPAPICVLQVMQEYRDTLVLPFQLLKRYRHGTFLDHPVAVGADPNAGSKPLCKVLASLSILPKSVLHYILEQIGGGNLDFDYEVSVASIHVDFPAYPIAEPLTENEPNTVREESFIVIFPAVVTTHILLASVRLAKSQIRY
ncbi:hypothetical protein LCGC14_1943360 [marine sediment metagenome]|uniref:Uncharacterized protein n=1 Tax=marine sediment metagenome TaxID=412755 RepID=A0A0F9IGS5_9ZZZZ